jgi:hypothetical protein
MNVHTVVIADDEPLVRQGARQVLELDPALKVPPLDHRGGPCPTSRATSSAESWTGTPVGAHRIMAERAGPEARARVPGTSHVVGMSHSSELVDRGGRSGLYLRSGLSGRSPSRGAQHPEVPSSRRCPMARVNYTTRRVARWDPGTDRRR